jgi:hypothetical protein
MIRVSAVMIASVVKYLTGRRALPPARRSSDARNSASRDTQTPAYAELFTSMHWTAFTRSARKGKIQKPTARASRVARSVNQRVCIRLRCNVIVDRLQISSTEATTQHWLCYTVSQDRSLGVHTRGLRSIYHRPLSASEGGFLGVARWRRCWYIVRLSKWLKQKTKSRWWRL